MNSSNSFTRLAALVLRPILGEARPRAKHQFCTAALEMFEDRITPSQLVTVPGAPFTPPGEAQSQITPTLVGGFSTSFSVSGNSITASVTNTTGTGHWVTLALYTAPGGGESTTSNAYDNLNSQNLIDGGTQTLFVAAHTTVSFSINVTDLQLTGQQKIQADLFLADSAAGYAPDKPFWDTLDHRLISGQLYDFDNPGGIPTQRGPGQ